MKLAKVRFMAKNMKRQISILLGVILALSGLFSTTVYAGRSDQQPVSILCTCRVVVIGVLGGVVSLGRAEKFPKPLGYERLSALEKGLIIKENMLRTRHDVLPKDPVNPEAPSNLFLIRADQVNAEKESEKSELDQGPSVFKYAAAGLGYFCTPGEPKGSGLFKTGAFVAIRLSYLKCPSQNSELTVPGAAFQFLVDDHESIDIVSIDDQWGAQSNSALDTDNGFFSTALTTANPFPAFEYPALQEMILSISSAAARKSKGFIPNPLQMTQALQKMARVNDNGIFVSSPPSVITELAFMPTHEIVKLMKDCGNDDFRNELSKIPFPIPFFRVFGVIQELDRTQVIEVGTVILLTQLVASEFGDQWPFATQTEQVD